MEYTRMYTFDDSDFTARHSCISRIADSVFDSLTVYLRCLSPVKMRKPQLLQLYLLHIDIVNVYTSPFDYIFSVLVYFIQRHKQHITQYNDYAKMVDGWSVDEELALRSMVRYTMSGYPIGEFIF